MAKGNRGGRRAGGGGIKASLIANSIKRYGDEKLSTDYWIGGLNAYRTTNKYITMDRVNADESRIVVKVADSHLEQTKYGHALILDDSHVVFVKDGQVNKNYYGNEVVLNKQYFNVKQWGDFSDRFGSEPKNLSFDEWVNTAKVQQKKGNKVKWENHYHSPKTKAIMKNMTQKGS